MRVRVQKWVVCWLVFAAWPVLSSAQTQLVKPEGHSIKTLMNTLSAMGNPVADQAAASLASRPDQALFYDLHLRRANLSLEQVHSLAEAIKAVAEQGGPALQSFSLSYNQQLGDQGVLVLVEALPASVTEIGLVQSGLGDQGAEALLRWAESATDLRWLCIEQNQFSRGVQSRLQALANERRGLSVIF